MPTILSHTTAASRNQWTWVIERPSIGPQARHPLRRVVVETRTRFHRVGIYDLHRYGRALFLDGVLQSAERDEHHYHETLVHPPMIAHPHPCTVFIAGGAPGGTLREVLRHPSVRKVVMADLDHELVALCREFMPQWSQGAFDDPRLSLVHCDARKVLERTQDFFDVCLCDLTDPSPGGPSARLYTQEFFERVRSSLSQDGIMATQAGPLHKDDIEMFLSITATLKRVFRRVSGFGAVVPSFQVTWGFACASNALLPSALKAEEVAGRLAARSLTALPYYSPERHEAMFQVPFYAVARRRSGVSSDAQPFYVRRPSDSR